MRTVLGAFLFAASVMQALPSAASPPCAYRTFETSGFTVCTLDMRSEELRLAWRDSQQAAIRSFDRLESSLGQDNRRVRFAMNAGMFDEKGIPIGLFIAQSRELVGANLRSGTGNFYLQPNGVFWVDRRSHVAIEATDRYVAGKHASLWATQSGPLLLIDGQLNPQIALDGPSKLVRNAVGIRDNFTAYFAISENPVSFGRLARFFRDSLGCRDALYLDGVVSSLWAPSLNRRDRQHLLGPMVIVLDR